MEKSNTEFNENLKYYSLERYFLNESKRLNQENPEIIKSVLIDEKHEKKNLKVEDWENELQSFINSDINKDAWINSYSIDSSQNSITYTALEDGLKTRKIKVSTHLNGTIEKIEIDNLIENNLYTSKETLIYIPNDHFSIKLDQKVLFMGNNNFYIHGKF